MKTQEAVVQIEQYNLTGYGRTGWPGTDPDQAANW
jgi:hypothetical protein